MIILHPSLSETILSETTFLNLLFYSPATSSWPIHEVKVQYLFVNQLQPLTDPSIKPSNTVLTFLFSYSKVWLCHCLGTPPPGQLTTSWSSVLERWLWKVLLWHLTKGRVRSTSTKVMMVSHTSAGRTVAMVRQSGSISVGKYHYYNVFHPVFYKFFNWLHSSESTVLFIKNCAMYVVLLVQLEVILKYLYPQLQQRRKVLLLSSLITHCSSHGSR